MKTDFYWQYGNFFLTETYFAAWVITKSGKKIWSEGRMNHLSEWLKVSALKNSPLKKSLGKAQALALLYEPIHVVVRAFPRITSSLYTNNRARTGYRKSETISATRRFKTVPKGH